jgi:hypothetical protein
MDFFFVPHIDFFSAIPLPSRQQFEGAPSFERRLLEGWVTNKPGAPSFPLIHRGKGGSPCQRSTGIQVWYVSVHSDRP